MAPAVKNRVDVEEEIRSVNQSLLKGNVSRTGLMLITMGVFEILFGLLAVAVSPLTGVLFALLTGAAILVSGVLEFVSAFAHNSLSRFAWGILGMVAGALFIARPVIGLGSLAAIAGIYLVASGLVRLFDNGRPLWVRIGGTLGILLGIVLLAQLGTASPLLIGLFVGAYILVNGALSINRGLALRNAAR